MRGPAHAVCGRPQDEARGVRPDQRERAMPLLTFTPPDSTRVRKEALAGERPSLAQVAVRLLRLRAGRPPSASTLWRWVVRGVPRPGRPPLHLEGCRVGCRWVSSAPALARFLKALNEGGAS